MKDRAGEGRTDGYFVEKEKMGGEKDGSVQGGGLGMERGRMRGQDGAVCLQERREGKDDGENETLRKRREVKESGGKLRRVDRRGPEEEKKKKHKARDRYKGERVHLFATHECTAPLPWKRQPFGL